METTHTSPIVVRIVRKQGLEMLVAIPTHLARHANLNIGAPAILTTNSDHSLTLRSLENWSKAHAPDRNPP